MSINKEFRVLFNNTHKLDIYISGNIDYLGLWSIEKAVKLNYIKKENNGELWSINFQINECLLNSLEYKYILGKQISDIKSIYCYEAEKRHPSNIYLNEIDQFGKFNNQLKIIKGNLQPTEIDVQIRIFGKGLNFFIESISNQEYLIDLLPYINGHKVDYYSTVISADLDGNCLNLPYINKGLFKNNEIQIQFNLRTINHDLNFFSLKLNIYDKKDESILGNVVLSGVEKIAELQTYNLPITFNNHIIGQLTFDVILTQPINCSSNKLNLNKSTFEHIMDNNFLYIGHRGSGKTFDKGIRRTNLLENTIESFNAAFQYVNMVEFDVMLTKDLIPVVFHDFESSLLIDNKKGYLKEKLDISVHEITYQQIRNLQFGLKDEFGDKIESSFDRNLEYIKQPFPLLEDLFIKVDHQIAFNIEIKYPQFMQDETIEDGLKYFFNRNIYLDNILKVCLPYVDKRTMVFSSFDADICHMLSLKQNEIPVMFLTSGTKHNFSLYKDLRTRSILSAINFAFSTMLYGVVTQSTELLTDSSSINISHSKNLKLYICGDENNNAKNIDYFKNIGVDAIILDDVQLVKRT